MTNEMKLIIADVSEIKQMIREINEKLDREFVKRSELSPLMSFVMKMAGKEHNGISSDSKR